MEKKKNDITMEKLVLLLAKYIKEKSKSLTEKRPSTRVGIDIKNWHGCNGKERPWLYDEIIFNGEHYKFYDKEIGRHGLVKVVQSALDKSGVMGKIKTREWEESNPNGWWYSSIKHIDFDTLTIYGKPCKEFKTLQNLIKKYSGTEIKDCEIYSADVCGKRSSWSESGDVYYLDFDTRNCQKAIDFIRGKRTSKDTMECKIHNKLDHGDEGDYQCAMYRESEWYGSNINYLEINIFTPSGKNKGNLKVSTCYVY